MLWMYASAGLLKSDEAIALFTIQKDLQHVQETFIPSHDFVGVPGASLFRRRSMQRR
ncbi:hypothetical protein BN873_980075 [Candidatus Competibacter denitrificans Run_A_D11]|uniref:Uncharacterized protein n=1 Tax=Candidatus Competibacter denitrificans Run_A_D11 TaxID=1400863 RepID=W6MBR6_9GAMM|nr:hypothetical protein BN873_980075 [Candidatus Competibacter denitrificans Run_A_D11]